MSNAEAVGGSRVGVTEPTISEENETDLFGVRSCSAAA
jgi:ketol-acid reductoisomerase